MESHRTYSVSIVEPNVGGATALQPAHGRQLLRYSRGTITRCARMVSREVSARRAQMEDRENW